MKRKSFFLAVWLMVSVSILAQNSGQEFSDRMNYIFQQVNKSRITTGLLSDYGMQPVEPESFNGIPADNNYVDMDTWKMLYTGMFTSRINNNISMALPETVFTQIENTTHATAVPVAMMHYQYNQLNESAVNLGLLRIVNDQIIDVPGAASPYLTKQLFAAAPKELYFTSGTVGFVFKSNLWYSNVNKTIQKREINFNNESGYLAANWDTPVSYAFNTGGVKTIYFRLTYTDGTSYTGKTNIEVTIHQGSLRSSTGDMDVPIQANSQHSGGTIQVRLSSYNHSGVIKKPLIVVEGFDVSCIMNNVKNVDINTFTTSNNPWGIDNFGTIDLYYSGQNLRNQIDYAQFDIIYLDYKNGVDDIFRNAQLFKEVIQWVNNNKQGSEQNIVMGISMGGLVARIALRQMELEGVNHQTSKYISVDSPHKGANVPVGFQALVRNIQAIGMNVVIGGTGTTIHFYEFSKQLANMVKLLDSPATQQMLIYRLTNTTTFSNTVHNQFQTAYDNLGFPQQCRNIAISNGSNNASFLFAQGANILNYNYTYGLKWWQDILSGIFAFYLATGYPSMLLNAVPGNSSLKMHVEVNALKNKTVHKIYQGRVYYEKKLLWLIPVNTDIMNANTYSSASMLPLDGAPGGKYSMDMLGGNLPKELSEALNQDAFCFVPTVSSFALNDWETKLTQNLTNTTTPFHTIFAQADNELHTRFYSPAQFLYNELITPVSLPSTITGPSSICPCTSGTFTVTNVPAGYTWGCSSNLTPVSGNQGTFTTSSIPGNGWVSINMGSTELVRKNIIIGYGSVSISGPNTISNNGYGRYYPILDCLKSDTCYWEFRNQSGQLLQCGVTSGISQGVSVIATPALEMGTSNYSLHLSLGSGALITTKYIAVTNGTLSMITMGISPPDVPVLLNVYPNPASDLLNVELKQDETALYQVNSMSLSKTSEAMYLVRLYDSNGNIVDQKETNGKKIQFNTSKLPNGFYFIHVIDKTDNNLLIKQTLKIQH